MRRALMLVCTCCLVGCGDSGPLPQAAEAAEKDLCPAYCSLAMTYCKAPVRLFDSLSDCLTRCAQLPSGGQLGQGSGDTVACRLTYLLAEPQPKLVMCTYARPTGSPACR